MTYQTIRNNHQEEKKHKKLPKSPPTITITRHDHNSTDPNPQHRSTYTAPIQTQKPTNLHDPNPPATTNPNPRHHLTHDTPIGANHTHIEANLSKPHRTHRSKQHASPLEQTTSTLEQTHWSKTSRRGLGLALLGDGGQ